MKYSIVLPIIILGIAGDVPIARAESPSTFTATGNLMTARTTNHTATLLQDGKVLIAGGESLTESSLASAELYDPAAGAFSRTGEMTTPRWLHTATLLPDGKVLIAGGIPHNAHGFLATAELYDTSTGIFNSTGSMVSAQIFHTATLLCDGRVLITGGRDSRGGLVSAEIYDPSAGTFRATATYAGTGECEPCAPATLLPDGKVLFAAQRPAEQDSRTCQSRAVGVAG